MKKLGSHVSFSAPNYLVGATEEALSYGANAMMIYLGAPQNAKLTPKEKVNLKQYEEKYLKLMPKENILVHAPYIINPASKTKNIFAIDFLINEINLMNYMGLKLLVLHPGAYTEFTREEAKEALVVTLKEVISKTEDVTILLETMAGKGTELGSSLEELKEIIKIVNSPRVAICLDTCHLWDAGYNVNNFEDFVLYLEKIEILPLIKAIHINDSKNDLAAHKDRHENLNNGFIKLDTLKKFVNSSYFDDAIKVLETPYVDGKPVYKKEIELLNK